MLTRVALDFPDVPERSNDERNRFRSTNFRENFENIFKKFSKIFAIACFVDSMVDQSHQEEMEENTS